MTEVVRIDPELVGEEGSQRAIARAGDILKAGGLVAFPTETVYGLGGNAFDPEASRRIYAAKGRPSDNPLIVHIARREDLATVALDIPEEAYRLADRFWPGPLTMILRKRPELPLETTGGLDTVAVRFPSHPVARALILAGGGFVAAPSANRSGRPSPTRAAHCIEDLDGRIPMIIDGGQVGIGVESSIVDLTEAVPTILRPGYVTEEMLRQILGRVRTDPGILAAGSGTEPEGGARPKAPGMRYRHYAPRGRMTLVEGEERAVAQRILEEAGRAAAAGARVAIIAAAETREAYGTDYPVYVAGHRSDSREIARNLFGILRQCDEDGIGEVFTEAFREGELSQAVMNRLEKACGHRILRC